MYSFFLITLSRRWKYELVGSSATLHQNLLFDTPVHHLPLWKFIAQKFFCVCLAVTGRFLAVNSPLNPHTYFAYFVRYWGKKVVIPLSLSKSSLPNIKRKIYITWWERVISNWKWNWCLILHTTTPAGLCALFRTFCLYAHFWDLIFPH